jgi:AcrR family transcriptional regulator
MLLLNMRSIEQSLNNSQVGKGPIMRKAGAERREDITGAAVAVLRDKGLAAATTRDVTRRLGVGVGLLSHYFSWGELRALAFERIVRADLQLSLNARKNEPGQRVVDDLVAGAFAEEADSIWRVWIEASDLASEDAHLAESVGRCTDLWRQGLVALLKRGNDQADWQCDDPEGAAWRLLALFDGLVGLVMAPRTKLERSDATKHLSVAIAHECRMQLGIPNQ